MHGGSDNDLEKPRRFIQIAKLSSVGLEMGIAVLLGWACGSWLDKKLGTTPWLMILFLVFGVAAGFKGVYVAARNATQGKSESKD